jgi:hypothetical protein
MKMYVETSTLVGTQVELIIEHNKEKLHWNVANFDKDCFVTTDHDICKHINLYWESLPHLKQEKIFSIFSIIRMIFEEASDTAQLSHALMPQIKALYDEHNQEEMSHWIAWTSDILIPENKFEEVYLASDEKPGNREKTYTKPDYRLLVTMALQLRIMIPIWGEFIYRTKSETGTNFKEYFAYQLLTHTKLMISPPMEKLRQYVLSNIKMDKPMSLAIISGIGSEDYPIWLLALVVVRRLCIGDITGVNQQTHLVTFIYNFISQKITGNNGSSFGGMIKDKEFDSPNSASDHNTSRIEGYKIKQESATGEIAILDYFMSDPYRVATMLKPDIDLTILEKFLEASIVLELEQLWKPQIVLTQLILAPVISPRGIPHISKKKVISAIAIAQTVLWQNGHKELACLNSAIASNSSSEMQLGGIDSRARVTKEQTEKLMILYPFGKVSSSKQKTKPINAGLSAIDSIATMFGQRDWLLTVPDEFARSLTGNESQRRYSCPYDIKPLLANFIINLKTVGI